MPKQTNKKYNGLADPRLGQRILAEARLVRYEAKIERAIKAALNRQKTSAFAILRSQTMTAAAPPDPFDLASWDSAVTDEVLPVIGEVMDDISQKVFNFLALPPQTRAQILGQIDVSANVDNFVSKVTSIGPNISARLIDELSVGVGQGESIDTLTDRLTSCFSIADNDATRIARTETHGAAESTTHDSASAISDAGYTVNKTWVATADERTRDAHQDADGQEVSINGAFEVDGESLMFPGDPDGSPGNVISCRCSTTYSMANQSDPDLPIADSIDSESE